MGAKAQVIHAALGAMKSGDVAKLQELFDQDVVLHVPGSNKLSGDYKGAGEVFGSFFATLQQLTGGQFSIDPHDVIDNDKHAIGVYRITATRDGKSFEWPQVNVYHVENGTFTEVWLFPGDFEAWNTFFS